uniref:Relaxin-3 receptor 1 n=1 Tax=Canis lupus familiaris TaxID=9615 RepID=A0A8C0YWQ0_CANLF
MNAVTMNEEAGGKELAGPFSLIPYLLQAANSSGNASLRPQDQGWELGLELPDGAAAGPPWGPGGAGSADTEARVRMLISAVYWVVCALGLTGNLLVLYLMKRQQGWRKSSINLFVTNLALTDFQFVLTLPFWAVENALDFRWPFGKAMCKIVSVVTSMNMYASVFFLTSMSVARYHSVASALKSRGPRGHGRGACCCGPSLGRGCGFSAKALCALLWACAALASLPNAAFSTTVRVMGDELCLVRFPDRLLGGDRQVWLGLYHLQKVLLGFVLPLFTISLCYLLLLRFISARRVAGAEGGAPAAGGGLAAASARRRSKVTRSVTLVVLSFFLCWLPNQALTTWSLLIKFNAVPFSQEYFLCQVYAFPVSVCLAHSNSCLNPVLYCLARREFRQALKSLLWRLASPSLPACAGSRPPPSPSPRIRGCRPWRLSTPRSPTWSTTRLAWWSTAGGATTCCPAAAPTDSARPGARSRSPGASPERGGGERIRRCWGPPGRGEGRGPGKAKGRPGKRRGRGGRGAGCPRGGKASKPGGGRPLAKGPRSAPQDQATSLRPLLPPPPPHLFLSLSCQPWAGSGCPEAEKRIRNVGKLGREEAGLSQVVRGQLGACIAETSLELLSESSKRTQLGGGRLRNPPFAPWRGRPRCVAAPGPGSETSPELEERGDDLAPPARERHRERHLPRGHLPFIAPRARVCTRDPGLRCPPRQNAGLQAALAITSLREGAAAASGGLNRDLRRPRR